MGLNSWGPTTQVCFKDVDWILNAFYVVTVTQLELKYTKSQRNNIGFKFSLQLNVTNKC